MTRPARPIILAITGASGAVYAVRLLETLLRAGREVELCLSPAGQAVLLQEVGIKVDVNRFDGSALLPTRQELASDDSLALLRETLDGGDDCDLARVRYHHYQDFAASIASGSHLTDGMVVCPCSGGSLSAIAHAASTNLIHRAADVQLKEGRKLILVPREAPLSIIQIENMQRCARAGAVVVPASPGWYHGVTRLRHLVDFVVARICDQLEIDHALMRRWGAS